MEDDGHPLPLISSLYDMLTASNAPYTPPMGLTGKEPQKDD